MVKKFRKSAEALISDNNLGVSLMIFAFFAVVITMVLFLIFSLVLSLGWLGNGSINVINNFIRIFSAFGGGLLGGRLAKGKGYMNGAIIGGIYMILAIFLSMLFVSTFVFDATVLVDFIAGVIGGTVGGMLGRILFGKTTS